MNYDYQGPMGYNVDPAQGSSNPTPTPVPANCSADITADNQVNVTDLLLVLNQWGHLNSPADINQDGTVSIGDFMIILVNWGSC